MHILSYSYRKI